MQYLAVAGIMGNGLLGAPYAGNLDELTEAGVYQVTTTATGKPTGLSDGILTMLSNNQKTGIGVQLAFGDGTFKEVLTNSSLSYGVDESSNVCVLVSNKKIIIKNNYGTIRNVTLYAINLPV